jgi:hypothetical protein
MKERDDAQQGHYLKEEYYIIHLKSALHCASVYLVFTFVFELIQRRLSLFYEYVACAVASHSFIFSDF